MRAWVLRVNLVLWDAVTSSSDYASRVCYRLVCVRLCNRVNTQMYASIQTCPVTAVTLMVPTRSSLFPFISCCRLGREPTLPPGTGENCSSVCRDFRRFIERFSWRDLPRGCSRGNDKFWPLQRPAEEKMGEGGVRWLV